MRRSYVLVATAIAVAAAGCSDDETMSTTSTAQTGGTAGAPTTGGFGGEGNSGNNGGFGGFGGFGGSGGSLYGDIGEDCDPAADTCADECLDLGGGQGTCIGLCTNETPPCPDQFACNSLFSDDGEVDVCLPNAACGALTFEGECTGDQLDFCDFDGPIGVDCASITGENGMPLQCAEAYPGFFDCVSSDFDGGCGTETVQGRCDVDNLIYCDSQENGNVVNTDCAAGGQVCVTAPDGFADCTDAGTNGCGTVTAAGSCNGDSWVRCENSDIATTDCTLTTQVCGAVDSNTYGCIDPPPMAGTNSVTGTYVFEKALPTPTGLDTGNLVNTAVRQALVRVLRVSDGVEVTRGFTNDQGGYTLPFTEATDVMVVLSSVGDPAKHKFSIRDCPLENCGGSGNAYSVLSAAFTPAASTDLGQTVITFASGIAGAFNLFDQFVVGAEFANTNLGSYPPPHTVQWKSGDNTSCQTSCFSGSDMTVFILSTAADTDEYDDAVIGHEYGHFLETAFSRSDSPGGAHDGSPTDPRLAWGEGYGTYVGGTIANTPVYIDTSTGTASVTDISSVDAMFDANPSAIQGMLQGVSEFMVAEVLWHIANGNGGAGKGDGPIFDVLGNYFTGAGFADRGVTGVELVDFLDGWFCRGHNDQPFIQEIVTTDHTFPYDYPTLAACP